MSGNIAKLMNCNCARKIKKEPCPFTNKDFESKDGMLTTVWGPALWHSLHMMSFNYPMEPTKSQKKYYMQFFKLLKYTLPCGWCRKNYKKNLQKHPLLMKHMKNRHTFSKWVYDLHELINKMLQKPKHGLSYKDVKCRYEHFRARCNLHNKQEELVHKKTSIKKEAGCLDPLYGVKSKCILYIVPKADDFRSSIIMDKRCKITRGLRKQLQ